jgi:hypothetical protein
MGTMTLSSLKLSRISRTFVIIFNYDPFTADLPSVRGQSSF